MGKTTASLAAAACHAGHGRNTLYLEIGEFSALPALLGTAPLTYEPRKLSDGLWCAKLTGAEALRDYLLRQIRVESLYHLFFENRPVRYFFDVAPALRDLMILGKIVHDLEESKSPGPFDRIVVDAPATGHGLFLLRAPEVIRTLVKFGPVFDRAGHILEVLHNPDATRIHVVTLARPFVVRETVEWVQALRNVKMPLGRLFINRILLPDSVPCSRRMTPAEPLLALLSTRVVSESRECARLQRLTRIPAVTLRENSRIDSLARLSEWIEGPWVSE